MKLVLALGVLAAGCGAETALWLRIEAPLVVPDACDAVQVAVSHVDGSSAFSQSFDLSGGPQFPLTLSLAAQSGKDVGAPLSVSVKAMKGGALAQPWASQTSQVTLAKGELTPLVVKLCACP